MHYALELLSDASFLTCKPAQVPMEPNLILMKTYENLLVDPTSYMRLIARLLYLTITWPNLTFAINNLNQFMDKLASIYLDASNKVLHYVKNIDGQGIFFSAKPTDAGPPTIVNEIKFTIF